MKLEEEQYELLARFVEAHLGVPRESRGKFIGTWCRGETQATFFHSLVNDLRFQGSMSDAEILAQFGLLSMVHGSGGSANFSVLPLGIEVYKERASATSSLASDSAPAALKLFVSHSSRDFAFVEPLVKLLRSSLNLRAREIRCTSVDGYRLQGGASIEDRLRKDVHDASAFVGIISPSSIDSMYVMFELGARWGAGKHLLPLLAPGTSASVLGGPLAGVTALRLDSAAQLHQLVSDLADLLEITPEPAAVYQSLIDEIVSLRGDGAQAPSKPDGSAVEEPAVHSTKSDQARQVSESQKTSYAKMMERAEKLRASNW